MIPLFRKCQNTEYQEEPLYGGYGGCRPLHIVFKNIPLENLAKNVKIPNIGSYNYMGAIQKRGTVWIMFGYRYSKVIQNSDFMTKNNKFIISKF